MKDIRSIESALAIYRQFIDRIDTICGQIALKAASAITCEEGCDACCEAIGVLPVEAMHIALYLGSDPFSDPQACIRSNSDLVSRHHCPFLENHSCRIYPVRPLICRTQGMAFLVEEAGERRLVHCPRNFQGMTRFPAEMLIDLDKMNAYLIRINQAFLQEMGEGFEVPDRIPLGALLLR